MRMESWVWSRSDLNLDFPYVAGSHLKGFEQEGDTIRITL